MNNTVGYRLIERNLGYSPDLLWILVGSLILISVAYFISSFRFRERVFFLSSNVSSIKGHIVFLSNFFLTINFLLVCFGFIYLFASHQLVVFELSGTKTVYSLLFLSSILLIPFTSFLLSFVFLPYNYKVLTTYITTYFKTIRLGGVFLFGILVFFAFNFRWIQFLPICLLITFLLLLLVRWIITFVKIRIFHVRWFYLILYLCTFELLPFLWIVSYFRV